MRAIFDNAFTDAPNGKEGQAGKNKLSGASFTSRSAKTRKLQRADRLIDSKRHFERCFRSTVFLRVVADTGEVTRGSLRPGARISRETGG
jgi:hypothetical protein